MSFFKLVNTLPVHWNVLGMNIFESIFKPLIDVLFKKLSL